MDDNSAFDLLEDINAHQGPQDFDFSEDFGDQNEPENGDNSTFDLLEDINPNQGPQDFDFNEYFDDQCVIRAPTSPETVELVQVCLFINTDGTTSSLFLQPRGSNSNTSVQVQVHHGAQTGFLSFSTEVSQLLESTWPLFRQKNF